MQRARTKRQLASYNSRYRDLARQLAEVDYIASGSVARRFHRCGRTTCACASDPPQLHGPYWNFTAKVDGKTVNKRLSEREARLYEQWISNDRKVRALLSEMREVAAKAQALILAEEPDDPSGRHPGKASPETRRRAISQAG
jgi:hypothetical protein